MRSEAPALAPFLRSDAQARVLAHVLLHDGEHTLGEIARRTGVALPTVQRETERLSGAGVFSTRKIGRNRMVAANPNYALLTPLTQIIAATYGPFETLADAFWDLHGVRHVIVFGSWTARASGLPGAFPRDIDVLVVGDVAKLETHAIAGDLTKRLGYDVNVTTMTAERWGTGGDGFVSQVRTGSYIELVRTERSDR